MPDGATNYQTQTKLFQRGESPTVHCTLCWAAVTFASNSCPLSVCMKQQSQIKTGASSSYCVTPLKLSTHSPHTEHFFIFLSPGRLFAFARLLLLPPFAGDDIADVSRQISLPSHCESQSQSRHRRMSNTNHRYRDEGYSNNHFRSWRDGKGNCDLSRF